MTQFQQLINTQPTARLEIERQYQVSQYTDVAEGVGEKKSYIPDGDKQDAPIGKQESHAEPHREPIKHLLTGSSVAVIRTIHHLQVSKHKSTKVD